MYLTFQSRVTALALAVTTLSLQEIRETCVTSNKSAENSNDIELMHTVEEN
jgi:hypothetical protein